ncbi:histidine kinase N-terminal 7TM domain-containing diguanylate cyclase [Paenibacillus sp. CAU 1782]
MTSHLTMYITLVSTSGVLTVFLFIYSFMRRREIRGFQSLVTLTLLQSIYIFANAFELSSSTLAEIKFWTVIEYIGIAFAPVIGLKLCLDYIGKKLSRRAIQALYVIPTITLLLVATNDWHHYFYKSIYLRPDVPSPTADIEVGYWYIVHGSFTFGCLLAGAVLLLRKWNQTKKAYKRPLFTLICGQFLPMVSAFVYLLGLTPWGIDPVPFVLCLTSAMYLWAFMSTRMLMIVPIAKEALFESMHEGVIVLDLKRRLIDYNTSVRRMLPGLRHLPLGRRLDEAWLELTGAEFPNTTAESPGQQEIRVQVKNESAIYQVRISTVNDRYGERIGYLLILIDITEQSRLQTQLKQMAYYDGLTGVFNRTQFIQRGKVLLEKSVQVGAASAVILFDIDHFKHFNDEYGHEVGDTVLIHTVNICKEIMPEGALFARYGGEEFVVAAPVNDEAGAVALAEELRLAISGAPYRGDNGDLRITASFGVAVANNGNAYLTLEELLRHADTALYCSKHDGRNRVTLHQVSDKPLLGA